MRDFAKRSDIPELTALWTQAFEEPEAAAAFYYQNRFRPEDTLLWRQDGRIAAQLTLMRVTQGQETGYYIYAVATHKDFRGRGLARELDRFASEEIRARGGTFACLVPASESLFGMYEKFGYTPCFPIRTVTVTGRGNPRLSLIDCSFPTFLSLRNAYLSGIEHSVAHPREELQYVYRELIFRGDYAVTFSEQGRECYAVYSVLDDRILLRETSARDPIAAANGILARHGREEALIRLPILFGDVGTPAPYGMGKRLDGKAPDIGYMMLMLD